ncbi:hypothetical protein pdam_00016683 [Pocillopora damicornis]|uniref:Uncharacterized protein n=1 Tax=Pocillopora damicornis TaxID=46731 RepID=A0A3M6V5G7_POCDA|nr:hypothetical protein pdam_00016683 [Pocillopora damicornis]
MTLWQEEKSARMDTIPKQTGPVICLFFICGRLILGQDPYVYFEKNWCRERTLRTDWRTYTHSCPSYSRHWAYEIWSDDFKTHPNLSFISGAEINPAGHFSKIYIQSVTVLNRTKAFGGDAWRVRVQGPADLVATVSDMENGTYEAKFLPMEPGIYSLQITLDYTLCHGLKNPPPDWFMRGCRHGSFQRPGTLATSDDYINRPLYYGAYFTVQVPPTVPQDAQYLDSLFSSSTQWCSDGCNLLLDGFGRWLTPATQGQAIGRDLVSYGYMVTRTIDGFTNQCNADSCVLVYSERVIIPMYGSTGWERYGGHDLNVTQVLEELRSIVTQPLMDEDSALVLNTGVHLLKSTSFRNYQKIIKGFIRVLKQSYRGRVVWKTTPSLGKQTELYTGCCRRFHTEQRIKLFNAYAMKKMCEAGIPVLDVYQISAAYPGGTTDGVHFPPFVFYPAEDALERYFTT